MWPRFEPGSASLTEAQGGSTLRGHPRRPPAAAKACATACNCRSTRVDRVDILAGSAPISLGITTSSGELGGILHGGSGWRRRANWAIGHGFSEGATELRRLRGSGLRHDGGARGFSAERLTGRKTLRRWGTPETGGEPYGSWPG